MFCPFTVRAMLSGPSEKEKQAEEDRRGDVFKSSFRSRGLQMEPLQ